MKCLFLSHWKDAMEVRVESNLTQNMKNHHFSGVRFLYNAYKKKFKGVILNYDQGMNYPWILQIFLSALFKYEEMKSPVLILTSQHDIYTWHYHMKQIGVPLVLLNDKNCKEVFENCDASIILASLSDLSIVHPYRDKKFEFVIVDQFDSVAFKLTFKKLSGNFNIALTNKDFMAERNQKLLWTMLNWTNPLLFGKLADFYKKDNEHLQNLRDPYDEVWHRLSWNFCESFVKETEEELEAYKKAIDDWKAANKMDKSEMGHQPRAAKRKLQKPEKNSKNSKEKGKKRQDHSSLAQQTQKTTNVEESQRSFESSFVNKNEKTLSCLLKNNSKLPRIIGKNVRTENQILKSASKAKRKSNFRREYNKYTDQMFAQILKSATEKKNTEKLELNVYEKQKNLSQDDTNNKQMRNKSLLEADILQEPEKLKCDCHNNNNKETKGKLYRTRTEDKVTQTDLPTLEETNNNFADNAKPHTENVTSNEDEEIPLVAKIIEDSPLKNTAGQCSEDSNTNTSSDAEESDILLSIIEGKFSASQEEFNMFAENKKGIASSINNGSTTKEFPRSNSESILMSLFGTEAEHVENLETSKQKVQLVESLNQTSSYSQRRLFLTSDCLSPVKCASEECRSPEISNDNKNDDSTLRKSNYETHVLESLFNFDEELGDYKSLKEDKYKLSDEERNTLITSLFGEQMIL